MSDMNEETPIRIVKKKGGHAGHHGGAWKVAYADFVTAMMSLFIVLWIVGQSKQVKESVASYFKDPGAFFENTKNGGVGQVNDLSQKPLSPNETMKREKEDQARLEAMGKTIMEGLSKDPSLAGLKNQINIEVVDEGLRIELREASQSFFFDIGTAKLKEEAVRILTIMAKEIGKLPNRVIIEGHTDSRQYSQGNDYTNFELSADRANSARRVLVTNGLWENQITQVRGYADSQLRNKKDPYDITNRRISIIIKKMEGTKTDEH
ncbi:MAG TPA: flagellar motor protein MotB [Bacteroidota bacterium]|nr:flagellar motor protein MotB [Bacteroidota bacterium]